jgi:hypothetical protein
MKTKDKYKMSLSPSAPDQTPTNWETPEEVEEPVRYHSVNSAWRR